MKEIQEILNKIGRFATDETAILATVADVVGSGYRRPGARMLIDADGYSIGTVSGGCLEADVLERAKKVLRTGAATVITYDTTADDNSVFGLSMGCRGIIRVLLEAVTSESIIFKYFTSVFEKREAVVIATLIAADDETLIGGRVYARRDGGFESDSLSDSFAPLESLKRDCRELFDGEQSSAIKTYETADGAAEFFIERVAPPLNLLLFGAGFDALPVVRFAKELGWRVSVIDHRAAYANRERIPDADDIIVAASEDLADDLFAVEPSAAVIMTHNYERDRNILRRLLHSKCAYIGALGPKRRTNSLLEEIGEAFDVEQRQRLYAPVGLDIGSETPEEIALAVIAEIKTVLSNRRGGFLRDR